MHDIILKRKEVRTIEKASYWRGFIAAVVAVVLFISFIKLTMAYLLYVNL